MNPLEKKKREILKKKRDLRKKILFGESDHDQSAMQRVYTDKTKIIRAAKVQYFGSKSKASGTDGEETSIEKFVRECLEQIQVEFIEQKALRVINVDFYLPNQKVAIQVHGCYYHACKKCYPKGPKNSLQRKSIEKDKIATKIVEETGNQLMEIWHHEIIESKDEVRRRIKEVCGSLQEG